MLYPLRAEAPSAYLTVTTDVAFGLRPQIDVSASKLKKFGGLEGLMAEAEKQATIRKKPLAIMDHDGNFVFKSSNWPNR